MDILANPGYADAAPALITPGETLASSLTPVAASGSAFVNPSGLPCTVVISGGSVSEVQLAPAGSSSFTEIGAGDGTYTIPAGAQVKLTYSAASTWTWTTF